MAEVCIPQHAASPFESLSFIQHHSRINKMIALPTLQNPPRLFAPPRATETGYYAKDIAFGSASVAQSFKGMDTEPSDISNRVTKALYSSSATNARVSMKDEFIAKEYFEDDEPIAASAPLNSTELEAIIRRISENVVIRDMPIKNAQWLQVPKGYLMDLELQPSHFFKHRTETRDQVRKRKRETSLPKWSSRGWQNKVQGFRPEEVNWNGAVCMDNCQPSNLTNAIHPLFDRACFDDTPDAIYDELMPALRLATLFLTQPICMQFWVTLAMGHRSNDAEMSAKNGKQSQRIRKHVELTAEKARVVIEHIKGIGKSKLIHFRFNRHLQALSGSDDKGSAYAISLPICDYKGLDSECHNMKGSLVRSIIRLHADYYVAAKKLSQLKFQEVSQKLRFSFGFAVLLVHELAHSIEGIHFSKRDHQWLDWHSSQYYKEPYWLDWHEAECGRAWEETMFGGHLQPINSRVDGSHGIGIADWPFGGSDEEPQSYRWWTVSMDYIENMFQMSTWQRTLDLKNTRIFNIPRDGATSLYINSFSTMNPSEEDRVAKEEMAELLARASEEPATKKRVTALGEMEERRPNEKEVIGKAVVKQSQVTPKQPLNRQVPMFADTRRLSSVMPGPLPDIAVKSNLVDRPVLIPHSRKSRSTGSNDISASGRKHLWAAIKNRPHIYNRFTPRQRDFLKDQHQKDLHRSREMPVDLTLKQKEPTSKLIKNLKAKPKGIFERHKERKRIEMTRRKAEESKSQEAAFNTDSKGPSRNPPSLVEKPEIVVNEQDLSEKQVEQHHESEDMDASAEVEKDADE